MYVAAVNLLECEHFGGAAMKRLDELVDTFEFLDDWDQRYQYLIELGEQLPLMPEELKIEQNKVKGCMSQVWISAYLDPENAYENWRTFMDQVREAVATAPKPIWLDEYNVLREWETHVRDQPEHGTYLAEVVAASLDARMQTSMIWLLFDQMYTAPADKANNKNSFYNGVHRWGTTKWPNDDIEAPGTPYPAWYAYSMMSKYLGGGEGTNVYKTIGQEGLHINAVRQKNGSWSFLVVNSNKSEKEFTIQFSDKLGCKLKRHIYDPAKVECTVEASVPGVDKIFKNVKKNFTDTLPAGAVAVYVTTRLANQ